MTGSLPDVPQHAFYDKLNRLLDESEFDTFVEALCEPFYADDVGRPGIPPGRFFRMLFVGYFEGLDSQRGIAWRCGDSRSLRSFLFLEHDEASPDHSSLSRIQRRLPIEVYEPVFRFVLTLADEHKLAVLMAGYESNDKDGAFVGIGEFVNGRDFRANEMAAPESFGRVFQRV